MSPVFNHCSLYKCIAEHAYVLVCEPIVTNRSYSTTHFMIICGVHFAELLENEKLLIVFLAKCFIKMFIKGTLAVVCKLVTTKAVTVQQS